jgi:vancomycin resistance protein YoaR
VTGTDVSDVQDATDGPGRPERRRRLALLIGGALAVLALAWGGAAWAVADRVPAGVEVDGVAVGGLSAEAARERLAEELLPPAQQPVPVTVGTAEAALDPAQAGLALDLDATVDDLTGFTLDPVALWRHVSGDADVEPGTTVDEVALTAALEALAADVDGEVVEGAVGFADGAPVVTEPRQGRTLDVAAAADLVAERWPLDDPPLALPARTSDPEVGAEAVQAAVDGFAGPATAGPLVVRVGDVTADLAPAQVTPALSMVAEDGGLVPRVDGEALLGALTSAAPEVVVEPRDADVVLDGGRPVVVPGQDGRTVDPAALAESALAALPAPERTAAVEPVVVEPDLTTAEAEALGVREVVSSFSTPLTADEDRTNNLRIAARTVDGTLLLPGETFSLNETLGERTVAKGYRGAGVILRGRLAEDVGGGVSQMATTLFNGMFFAGLEDVEHRPHSFYISRYPEGREATVNWGTIDLRFRNDTEHGVLIQTWLADGQVNTRFWSTKTWDIEATKSPRRNIRQPEVIRDSGEDCVSQSPNVGFDVTVTRVFRRGGAVQRTEEFVTRYNASDQVICT